MTNSYLSQGDASKCYGCGVCAQACPQRAISMHPNQEGFVYPVLDDKKCVDCGLCKVVCPYDNPAHKLSPRHAYAMRYLNYKRYINSSSGGAFPAIADYILNKGGYVAGCIFDSSMVAVHVVTDDIDTVQRMSGSKYVQSNVLDIYPQIKSLLDIGHTVLFSGTPCQVAALRKFLKKPYDGLLTVDLICHGVPSPLLFKLYLTSVYGDKIEELKFRNKVLNGWCSQGSVRIRMGNGKFKIKKITPYTDSYYYYYYLQNNVSRMSCYKCAFAAKDRVSDITIGDYWNISDVLPTLDSRAGISAVLVNTLKGEDIIKELAPDIELYETSVDDVVRGNSNLSRSTVMPPERRYIYDHILKNGYLKTAREECNYQYVLPFLKKILPTSFKRAVREIIIKKRK